MKVNSISDYKMIDKLYEASQSGVKIQLIVRGICSLVPGIKGFSDNIEVISIIDRFLEHSRIMIFQNNNDPKVYISSADLMTRNIHERVEVACPIYDNKIKNQIIDTFSISWSDNIKSRIINLSRKNIFKKNKKPIIRSQTAIYDYFKSIMDKNENWKIRSYWYWF